MTLETLVAARVLHQKIISAEKRITEWQGFTGFADDKIEAEEKFYVPAPDSASVLQNYNLRYWERELERLQREFDAL